MSQSESDVDATDDGPIEIRVGLGHPGDQVLDIRVSPHAAPEMRTLMEAEGVFSGEMLEFSAGNDLAIYAGSFLGGLGGLAAVLTAFFHRNQHKSINFSHGDDSVELRGYSNEEVEHLITETLEELRKKQIERDKEWERIKLEWDKEQGK